MKTPADGAGDTRTNPRLELQPSPILRTKASERKKRSRYSRAAPLGQAPATASRGSVPRPCYLTSTIDEEPDSASGFSSRRGTCPRRRVPPGGTPHKQLGPSSLWMGEKGGAESRS